MPQEEYSSPRFIILHFSRILLMNKIIFPLVLCASLFLGACSPQPLADIEIPLMGESVMAAVEGDPYRFFRYETADDAEADIAKVSSDGRTIDGKRMPWDGPVHIYHLAKRIVVYVGDNEHTMQTIVDVFGPQVAGD